jgi:GNAT superfamily N-acetyltransferase
MEDDESKRIVRTIREGEEEKHLQMLNLAFEEWGSVEEWRKKYVQPDFDLKENVLVIEEKGKWAGGGTAWFRDAFLRSGKKIRVYMAGDLYVNPEFRGKGVYSTAMESLNKMASAKGAVLAFAFPSIYRLPSIALPKYGFVNIAYPKTRLLVLNPENFLSYILSNLREAYLPPRFDGMHVRLAVHFDSPKGRRCVTAIFRVEKGTISESDESRKIDLHVAMTASVLLKISSGFYLRRRMLFVMLISAVLRRQLKARFSRRFLRAFLGL